jgi:hypothetical protein
MTKRSNLNLRTWALLLNGVFWVCFWVYFILAAKVDDPKFCMDHCHPAYAYWGHGVGYNANPFSLAFMRAMAYLQFPSFIVTKLAENVLTREPLAGAFNQGIPNLSGGIVFLGISFDGYQLLLTMLLSFVQWILVAKILSWLIQKFAGASSIPKEG